MEDLSKALKYISDQRGIDLCSYRQNFTFRHLRYRFQDTGAGDQLEYIRYLKAHPEEIDRFLDSLSINVTHFFRDPQVFKAFGRNIVPELLKRKVANDAKLIRIWSAACASGQEPYSIAILLLEALGKDTEFVVKIWATDIDQDALERAQEGVYEERDVKEVDKKLLEKYFEPVYNGKYSIKDEVKKLVRFERLNLITDPGLKFMDAVFCRNVMIYFSRQQQEALFKKFHQSLNSQGYLVIARVETIWERNLFEVIDSLQKIYRKID